MKNDVAISRTESRLLAIYFGVFKKSAKVYFDPENQSHKSAEYQCETYTKEISPSPAGSI